MKDMKRKRKKNNSRRKKFLIISGDMIHRKIKTSKLSFNNKRI